MIIVRYLVRETFKSQLAIFFTLILIFFCQNLIKILGAVVDGEIPTSLVLSLLGLNMPEMAQMILPLSLFLCLLMTFGKLYAKSEITVMCACGLSKVVLVKAAMILALFTGITATANVMWVSPLSSRYRNKILAEAKANPGIAALAQGQFQQVTDGDSVLFIESIERNYFSGVFFAQLHPKDNTYPSVVIANSGHLEQCNDGSQVVTLNQGTRFEGTATLHNFRITNFQNYQAIIGHQNITFDPSDIEQMNIWTLIKASTSRARAELHWRITLIFAVFIMALMVVPLSTVNSRQSRLPSLFPAMLLYLVFFLLQTSIRSNGGKGKIDPIIWIWVINSFYFLLAIGLNLWDTVLMRRLRTRIFI